MPVPQPICRPQSVGNSITLCAHCALRCKSAHNTNGGLSNDFLPLDSFANVRLSVADVAVESNLQFTVTVLRKPQRERVKRSLNNTHI